MTQWLHMPRQPCHIEVGPGSINVTEEKCLAVNTMRVGHLEDGPFNLFNKFSVSQSGLIALACWEGDGMTTSSLLVFKSNTSKPKVLSHGKIYHSVSFVKMLGKEYLAATCLSINTSIIEL